MSLSSESIIQHCVVVSETFYLRKALDTTLETFQEHKISHQMKSSEVGKIYIPAQENCTLSIFNPTANISTLLVIG